MWSLLDQKNYTSLFLNITMAVALCLAINAVIFGSGWDASDTDAQIWFAPPGYVVGTVWVILFGLIGAARYLLNASGETARSTKNWLVILLLFCLAYPIYTIGFNSELIGFLGNLATIALTVFVLTRTLKFSKLAAFLLVPIILWVSFATLIVMAELGWI
jgi:translocator protein